MTASVHLTSVLAPLVSAAGYDLEDLQVSAAGRRSVVRVLVDRSDGAAGSITLDDVAEVSRVVSDALDAEDEKDPSLLGASYVLEVSSPGVDRPLTEPRHWRRNVGRLVQVHPVEGATCAGRLTAADDDQVTLDVDGEERVVPLADVRKGLVQVEFNRKDAAADTAANADADATEDEDTEEDGA